jgi:hypothetical protein
MKAKNKRKIRYSIYEFLKLLGLLLNTSLWLNLIFCCFLKFVHAFALQRVKVLFLVTQASVFKKPTVSVKDSVLT